MPKTIQEISDDAPYQDLDTTVLDLIDYLGATELRTNFQYRSIFDTVYRLCVAIGDDSLTNGIPYHDNVEDTVRLIILNLINGGSTANATTYTFNTASPSAISSYARASTNEFYRDNTGKFVNAASNQIRYDCDFDGTPLGIRFDHPSTNKCTNYNWNMTDFTGITIAGNASASVTVSTHPVHGHPTYLIDNTLGGSGSAYITIDGTFANTNIHSMRTCTRVLVGATTGVFVADSGGQLVKTAADCGLNAVNKDGFIFNEGFTPLNSSRSMRIVCAIGCKAHFWLNQLEEYDVCTFPLLVAGATSTRTLAIAYINLSSIETYNESEGTLLTEAVFDKPQGVLQYITQISNGTGTSDTYALTLQASGQVRPRTAIAFTPYTNEDIHGAIRGKRFPMATSWKNGKTFSAAGPMTWRFDTYTGAPTGMNRLNIGGRGTNSPFAGWIRSIAVLDKYQEQNQLAAYMFPPVRTYRGIWLNGQSIMHGRFRTQDTAQNAGEVAAIQQMDLYYQDSENWAVRGAINGSAADKVNDIASGYTNWWYDSATSTFGPVMTYAKSVVTAFGKSRMLPVVGWDQGQTDAGDPNLKANTKAIFDEFVNFLGAGTKVAICPISRRQDNYFDSYSLIKKQKRELATENPSYIFEAPPQDNITTGADNIHLIDSSYAYLTKILFRKMMSVLGKTVADPVDPPSFSAASRSGLTVTIPVIFPSGMTAITPTTGISGFRCFDGDPDSGGTEINVTAATYGAGNITLTLASLPSGSLYLEFGRGSLHKEYLAGTIANLPRGNDVNALGMAWNKIIVT